MRSRVEQCDTVLTSHILHTHTYCKIRSWSLCPFLIQSFKNLSVFFHFSVFVFTFALLFHTIPVSLWNHQLSLSLKIHFLPSCPIHHCDCLPQCNVYPWCLFVSTVLVYLVCVLLVPVFVLHDTTSSLSLNSFPGVCATVSDLASARSSGFLCLCLSPLLCIDSFAS